MVRPGPKFLFEMVWSGMGQIGMEMQAVVEDTAGR